MISSFHLTYGVVSKALAGEVECGDQWLIKEFPDAILVAVADGLGHGKEAAVAAKKALAILNDSPDDLPLLDFIKNCHTGLQGTRGTVLSLVKIQKNYQVTWLGVGNIMGLHWGNPLSDTKPEELFSQGGVIGYLVPHLHAYQLTAGPGHSLILATDGLNPQFINEKPLYHQSSQSIADHLFQKYHNDKDDALILVIHWEQNT